MGDRTRADLIRAMTEVAGLSGDRIRDRARRILAEAAPAVRSADEEVQARYVTDRILPGPLTTVEVARLDVDEQDQFATLRGALYAWLAEHLADGVAARVGMAARLHEAGLAAIHG